MNLASPRAARKSRERCTLGKGHWATPQCCKWMRRCIWTSNGMGPTTMATSLHTAPTITGLCKVGKEADVGAGLAEEAGARVAARATVVVAAESARSVQPAGGRTRQPMLYFHLRPRQHPALLAISKGSALCPVRLALLGPQVHFASRQQSFW